MKKIQVGGNRKNSLIKGYALVDDKDYEKIKNYTWFLTDSGYAAKNIKIGDRVCYKPLHWFIKKCDKPFVIDHINGDKLDNRQANLRVATIAQNNINSKKQKNSTSKYKGVFWSKAENKWKVRFYIGSYSDEIEAAKAYDKGASIFFGEFARLNFPTKNRP